MIEDDLDTFCSDATVTTRIAALKRILHTMGRNGFDYSTSQRFHEICAAIFTAESHPLLAESKVVNDLLSLLKFDDKRTSSSLPVILENTIRHSQGFIDNSSPYFILLPNKLPIHIQSLLKHGEIELLPSFLRNRIEMLSTPQKPSSFISNADRIPTYEIRLNILEFYFYWFIQFPKTHKVLPVSSTEVTKKVETKSFIGGSNLPDWINKTSAMISPKKISKKTKTKTNNIYLDLLNNYLENFVPYGDQKSNIQGSFLEFILMSWFDYGSIPRHLKDYIHQENEVPGQACLHAIKEVVLYAISDPNIRSSCKQGTETTTTNYPIREVQKPLYDFLCQSFSILSDSNPSQRSSELMDIWMTFILPWNATNTEKETKKEISSLSDDWVLFVNQNILFYLTPTANFLEYVKMNFNTATREQDLQLFERFLAHFLELDLYKTIQDAVLVLLDIKSGDLYTNQTPNRAIIQRHFAALDVNISQFDPLFTTQNSSLPLEILRNLSNDIFYCMKYLPDASHVSRIEKAASDFAIIFDLESEWQRLKPSDNGQKAGSSQSYPNREKKSSHNSRYRLLEVELQGDYWKSPLMTFENGFVARHAFFLAVALKNRYNLEELPRIRWAASYKIWGLVFLCLLILFVVWKFAVFLAFLITG